MMGIAHTVYLQDWRAWSPGLSSRSAWLQWLHDPRADFVPDGKPPACRDVPAMVRRRCSFLSRMVLEVAFPLCRATETPPDQVCVILCTRHGEIGALKKLLHQLASNEPLSPTLFSHSVHHAPMGSFAMLAGNTGIVRALSAGGDGFLCGCLEVLGLLQEASDRRVLFIMADERPPDPFTGLLAFPVFPYALALMWSNLRREHAVAVRLEQVLGASATTSGSTDATASAFQFLRWCTGPEQECRMPASFGTFVWKK